MTEYRCIVADPPWAERGGGKIKRGADRHYPLMDVKQIARKMSHHLYPDERQTLVSEDGCHLWLWVTDNHLTDGLWLMDALGFLYLRTMAWVKLRDRQSPAMGSSIDSACSHLQIGLGQYLRGSHELCLLGRSGPTQKPSKAQQSVIFAERTKHSAKPVEAFELFEATSPGPRLEMFARSHRDGWDVWGNEV